MVESNAVQGELFPELQTEPHQRRAHPALFPHRFLRMRVAYEDLIFMGLALILVLLAGYCLGVERGKRLSPQVHPLTASDNHRAASVEEFPVASSGVAGSEAPKGVSVEAAPAGLFVIQLASYLDQQAAELEARRLKRQGFSAQVIKQGRYFELRAVGYRSKAEAAASLAALRNTYHDGFIKRIESNKT